MLNGNADAGTDNTVPAIEARGLSVTYETGGAPVEALHDISFSVAPGGFLSIIGPSGCGKSTILRAIADLTTPSAGTVSVFGASPAEARRARRFAFIFQDANLLPWRTVRQNVALPFEVGGAVAPADLEQRIDESLSLVGLSDQADRRPDQLSGGMRQRVAIARALVVRPQILLMDEPFGALDEITRDRLNRELLDLWSATGTTILFVTHSIAEAAYLGRDVMVMTPAPGRVHEMRRIDLDHPRPLSVRDTLPFVTLTGHLRTALGAG